MRLRLAKHSVPEDSSRDPGRGEGRRCRCVLVCTHQSFARRSVSQSCERLCSLGCVHCQRRLSLPFHCLSLNGGKGGSFEEMLSPVHPYFCVSTLPCMASLWSGEGSRVALPRTFLRLTVFSRSCMYEAALIDQGRSPGKMSLPQYCRRREKRPAIPHESGDLSKPLGKRGGVDEGAAGGACCCGGLGGQPFSKNAFSKKTLVGNGDEPA